MSLFVKLFLVLMLGCTQLLKAQKMKLPLFRTGDKICFIGNSITNNGEFYNQLQLFYATRYPELDINFYNCGISGDVTGGVIKRMDDDILIHKPTWSFVMLGMNDVNRGLYKASRQSEPNIEELKKQALDIYKIKLEVIVKKLLENKSKVVLQKPTIYDQTAKLPEENLFGVNDALKKCAGYIQELADKYKLQVVDYHSILNDLNAKVQRKDSSATLTTKDRVHPQSPGHFIMAYQWLTENKVESLVTGIKIKSVKKANSGKCINCEIVSSSLIKDTLMLQVKGKSLPFPIYKDAVPALSLVPFQKNFNQELFSISNIKSGNYQLLIDDVLIGTYDSFMLKKGINLAENSNTPQYKQAVKVMDLCREYRTEESKLRGLKFVEYGQQLSKQDIADLSIAQKTLNQKLEKYRNASNFDYFKYQFGSYISNKPKQLSIEKRLEKLHNIIFTSNIPMVHTYKIYKSE